MNLLDELSNEFGVSRSDLSRIIATAPKRYKVYPIKKRDGSDRIIAQPSRELKAIQRYIVDAKLSKLRVHSSAMGYVPGKNIFDNAEAHRRNRALLKLDFTNFFPSIVAEDWQKYVAENPSAKKIFFDDLASYTNILFWGKKTYTPVCLSIGAPSSPILSNILMYRLDAAFSSAAKDAGVTYTRYADDLTLSGSRVEDLIKFEDAALALINKTRSPRLRFNNKKRGVFLLGQRRMVTGLVLTIDGQVSLGRERKRLISAMMHHASVGKASEEDLLKLKGLLGFAIANEPDFISRLRGKYGNVAINDVLKFQAENQDNA